ncbi:hypothetical protein E4U36_006501 [Claviceps purpurea]|nr:hypothetical protein E4U36_006501 [Claviceps purpurea]
MSATGSVIGFVTGARLQQLPQHNHQATTTTTTPPPPDDCGQTTIATCLQPACMQHVTGALAATGSGITGGSRRWAHATKERDRPPSLTPAPISPSHLRQKARRPSNSSSKLSTQALHSCSHSAYATFPAQATAMRCIAMPRFAMRCHAPVAP